MREVKYDCFIGYMENKKLRIPDREKMEEFISGLSGEVMITVEEIKNRTQYQNNYYWKIIRFMANSHPFDGYSAEELHDAMKESFNVSSTTRLNKEEFSVYINKIIRLANENNVQVPVKD